MLLLEVTLTYVTLVFGAPKVDSQVLGEIGFLGEALIASRLLTDERALPSMNSQMIEKVMPLAEEHPAVVIVTFQNFDLSHCTRIFILVDAKFAR